IEEVSTFDDGPSGGALFGTHPIVYATAGKHHWLQREDDLQYACGCGPFGKCGAVRDRADGRGKWIVPPRVEQVPVFVRDEAPRWAERSISAGPGAGGGHTEGGIGLRSASALDSNRNKWWNACELEQNGRLVPAVRALRSDDLTDLGYPGERIDGDCFR